MIWPFNHLLKSDGVHRQLAVVNVSKEEEELGEVETKKEELLKQNKVVTQQASAVAHRHMNKSRDVRKTVRDLLTRIEKHDQSHRSAS